MRRRTDQRQSFLVSAIVHLLVLMIVGSRPASGPRPTDAPVSPPPSGARVFLPPPEVLRQLIPRPPAAPLPRPAVPAPQPAPAEQLKERISIGAPVQARQQGPLVLRREDDLTQVAKGRPDATSATPAPAPPTTTPPARQASIDGRPELGSGADVGLRLPPGLGSLPSGREGTGSGRDPSRSRGTAEPSIASSLQDLDRRLQQTGALGLPSGTGKQMGPLFFDPEGADFTLWLNHFKNEVYRNWIVPQAALLGFHGAVEIEFVVERDGSLSGLRVLKPSGTVSLDRAAENSLRASRFLPLPADYRPVRVPMRVTFFYNTAPQRES